MVSLSTDVRDHVNRMLAEKYEITHTTLQLECSRCETVRSVSSANWPGPTMNPTNQS